VKSGSAWHDADALPGDAVFFHFSGHAARVPDFRSEELDAARSRVPVKRGRGLGNESGNHGTRLDLVELVFQKGVERAALSCAPDAKRRVGLRGSVHESERARVFLQSPRHHVSTSPMCFDD